MTLSPAQSILIIAICAICTFAERLFPFAVFAKRKVPAVITYLGKILPIAVMTTLVIYCLRSISFSDVSSFLPQFIAVAVTVLLHLWRKNTLLSVVGGTACHMLLVQFVF